MPFTPSSWQENQEFLRFEKVTRDVREGISLFQACKKVHRSEEWYMDFVKKIQKGSDVAMFRSDFVLPRQNKKSRSL
jgi:hypothetical protein